jgi:DNA invertase Pin-like site-specific DNA recombinase
METNSDEVSPKKTALYCRVSTGKQTNDNQKIRLIQYAKDQQLEYDLFEEVESTRNTRPIKQMLLQKLRAAEYSQIVIYKLDRYARSSRELILEVQELIDKGIGFVSVSDNLDFTNAVGRLHFQILSAFSEFERSLISERTKEGINRAKAQGKKLGRPKGSKDSKARPKSGYLMRELNKRKNKDEKIGIYKPRENYVKQSSPK